MRTASRGRALLAAQTSRKTTTASSRFVLSETGTEARYVVRELLVANTIENEVIGRTTAVSGGITLDRDSKVVAADSRILIDLTTVKTGRERRVPRTPRCSSPTLLSRSRSCRWWRG